MRYFTLVLVLTLGLVASNPVSAQEIAKERHDFVTIVFDWLDHLWADWTAPSVEKDGETTANDTLDPEAVSDDSDTNPGDEATGFAFPNG